MENVRNVLEVDVGDIPTKAIDKEKNGFYLFVHGELEANVLQYVSFRGLDKVRCKVEAEEKYYFPLIKKDLAMFVFYGLFEFGYRYRYFLECFNTDEEYFNGYYFITRQFLPRYDYCEPVSKITTLSMVLLGGGKLSEVTYNPKYQLKGYKEILQQEVITSKDVCETDTAISSREYRHRYK